MRLLFFALLLPLNASFAQSDFRSGYIINSKGDTLLGHIDYRNELLMSKVCHFRPSTDVEETKYNPSQIRAFRFDNGKYYVSKQLNGSPIFLEFLLKGQINVYFLKDKKGDHYYFEKEGNKLREIRYTEKIIEKNGKKYVYKSTTHKGILNNYMLDAPKMKASIESIIKPTHQNLIKLAKNYHNEVCKDDVCIVYEKQLKPIKFAIEPVFGILQYGKVGLSDNVAYENDKNTIQLGTYLYIWLPRTNENIHFKTGLVYQKWVDGRVNNNLADVYKLPLQLQYLFPNKKLRPRAHLGFNFYTIKYSTYNDFLNSLEAGLGINYEISNSVSISANINTEVTPLTYIIDNIFGVVSYSFQMGVYIAL